MYLIDRISENDLIELSYLYNELEGYDSNIVNMKKVYQKIINDSNYYLIGIKDKNDQLLGTLCGIICYDLVGECNPFMVIENVVVKSNYKGLGLGSMLINYIEEIAIKNNVVYIILTSSNKRKEAHKFYEKLGYNEYGVRGFKKFLK